MLRRAADEIGLDLERSWLIGDILDDIEAGNRAGCRTVLVDLGTEQLPETSIRRPAFVARDTIHALDIVLWHEGASVDCELMYWPRGWDAGFSAPEPEQVASLASEWV
jgi:D-glycero-D-manno-heptose 1,7-bisphosphate phosphatase